MAPGSYVDYHFNGWRINHHAGGNSGYTFRDADKEAEWEIYTPPAPVVSGWDMAKVNPPPVAAPKRRGRKPAFVPPPVIDDVPWQGSKAAPEPVAAPKPSGWD